MKLTDFIEASDVRTFLEKMYAQHNGSDEGVAVEIFKHADKELILLRNALAVYTGFSAGETGALLSMIDAIIRAKSRDAV